MTTTVLLAEDDTITREMLIKIIQSDPKYTVIAASDGERAMHLLEDNPHIDILVTDMAMPKLGGRQIIQRITTPGSPYEEVPIIVISGVVKMHEINDILSLGAKYFLPKPIEKEALFQFLEGCSQESEGIHEQVHNELVL